jgi:hypothetical protein
MILLFLVVVVLPALAGLYWLSRCGAATRTVGRVCYRARRGPFIRCRDHGWQIVARGDLMALGCFGLAYGGLRLWQLVD